MAGRAVPAALILSLLLFGGAQTAELRTLKGESIKGGLVSVSNDEIVIERDGAPASTPASQVLQLELAPTGKPPSDAEYLDIELTDGTRLHCTAFSIKGKEVTIKPLLTGEEIRFPLDVLASYLKPAHDVKLRLDWDARSDRKRTRDVLAVLRDGVVNPLEGTLGVGDDSGEKIEFTLTSGAQVQVPIANAHGLLWLRDPDPTAPPVICRLFDLHGNVVMVSSVTSMDDRLVVTTPSGVKLSYPHSQLSRLDYSKGRLTFLSDLTPVRKVLESVSGPRFGHLMLDRSLNGKGPLVLKGQTYPKGLAMFTHTDLEYDLSGEYQEFRASVGIDDLVGGSEGPVHLLIEGDGKELFSLTLSRVDQEAVHDVTLNIRDVRRLRIVVSDPEKKDIGKHLNLANAQVRKSADGS